MEDGPIVEDFERPAERGCSGTWEAGANDAELCAWLGRGGLLTHADGGRAGAARSLAALASRGLACGRFWRSDTNAASETDSLGS